MKALHTFKQAALAGISTLLCLTLGVTAFDLIQTRNNRKDVPADTISRLSIVSRVPESLYTSLGWYTTDERSAAFRYGVKKPANIIRIGAFGDSNTFGDEVPPGADFPFYLERLFKDAGITNVEVLNFGGSGWGCHQSYKLWENYARNFELDAIVIGPNCQHFDRDETFGPGGFSYPGAIHGRYVLSKDDDLAFIDAPTGSTLLDRYDSFFGLFSGLRYLPYDRNLPLIVNKLRTMGFSSITNPFYYSNLSSVDEQTEIYRRMTRKLHDVYGQVITLHWDKQLLSKIAEAGPHSVTEEYYVTSNYPFWRKVHVSAPGNYNYALAYYGILTGQDKLLRYSLKFSRLIKQNQLKPRRLDAYSEQTLHIDQYHAGSFVYLDNFVRTEDPDRAVNFMKDRISGLIGISGIDDSLSGSLFFPIRGDRFNEMPEVTLVRTSASGSQSFKLETSYRLTPELGLYQVEIPGLTHRYHFGDSRERIFWDKKAFEKLLPSHGSKENWTLKIGDIESLDLVDFSSSEYILKEKQNTPIILRMGKSDSIDMSRLPDKGQLVLSLKPFDRNTIQKFPLASFSKEHIYMSYPRERLKFVIQAPSGSSMASLKTFESKEKN